MGDRRRVLPPGRGRRLPRCGVERVHRVLDLLHDPIFLAAWFGNRVVAVLVAVTCGLSGFAADIWTLDVLGVPQAYAFVNVGLRLILFGVVSILFSHLHDTLVRGTELAAREREAADREREAAERLQDLNEMKDRLMRSVVADAREPLGDIYARVVTLGFDMPRLTMGESREVLNKIADANRRLSALVDTLLDEQRAAGTPAEPGVGAIRKRALGRSLPGARREDEPGASGRR